MYLNFLIFQIIFILIAIIVFLIFIIKGIGIAGLAKRRNIKNSWLAFIPIMQDYMLGKIIDNINAFKYRKTYYCFWLFILSCYIIPITTICMFSHNDIPQIFYSLNGIFATLYRILTLIVCFSIYRDYSPKNWVLLGFLSIFLQIESLCLLGLRKNVPMSMCFNEEEEWQFEANQPQLKMIWQNYHYYKPMISFGEYLIMMNFTPNMGFNPMMGGMMMGGFNPNGYYNSQVNQFDNNNQNNNKI